ncbi:MAG: hypothetical protein IKU52_08885 [Clostridia bacterium]|nr:hypothetical protein [Clostridia bacterium]
MKRTVILKNIGLPFTAYPEEAVNIALLRAKKVGLCVSKGYIYKRSIDSRRKDDIKFVYSVALECEGLSEKRLKALDASIEKESWSIPESGKTPLDTPPVVCGFGPAGMFAALILAEQGYKPVVLERGSDVKVRRMAVDRFMKTGILDTECNIQYGAGGAGTLSDGKLVTRISDPACRYIFQRLVEFGAPEEIMYDAKPHVGTDKLLNVVENISNRIIALGGKILYDTRLTKINRKNTEVISVETTKGEIECGALILAIGNSARDTYRYLISEGYDIENKPFSVGVRIEHMREDIDKALYGDHAGNPLLGAAPYAYSKRVGDVGVYTFCMCPGGEVVAATSMENAVVTNGMSYYARNGRNSNAAILVSVNPENPIEYQERLERAAFTAGGGEYYAPMQTVGDFMEGKTGMMPQRIMPTYMGGKVRNYDLNRLFTKDINDMLRLGIASFDKSLQGFAAKDAILTGVETRTSAPVRIKRNEKLLAQGTSNLYPCGEGAGYAGGITSAAADGLHCAKALIEEYERKYQ